jgi:hypothetical protein
MTFRLALTGLFLGGCLGLVWAGETVYTLSKDGLNIEGKVDASATMVKWQVPGGKNPELKATRYDIKLTGGKQYLFSMEAGGIDSVIIIENHEGDQLASDDDSGSDTNALLTFDALKDGIYHVYGATLKGLGPFTLKVREVGPIKVYQVREKLRLEGEFRPHQVASMTCNVKLAAETTYNIDMTTTDATLNPYLKLLDSDGKLVAEDDDSGGEKNARLEYRPKAAGVFQIVTLPFDENSASGRFVLQVRVAGKDEKAP